MALKKTQLLDITSITGIATVGIYTVGVTATAGGVGVASTYNIITGTAATFTNNVNISGITTVGVLTAYAGVNVTGIVTATSYRGDGSSLTGVGGDTDITSSLFI